MIKVNIMVMEKKIYTTPLMEVEKISLSRCLLEGSSVAPVPPHPGAPARRCAVPVF